MPENFIVLIPCAGTGTRYGHNIPKQYSQVLDKTILEFTLKPFINSNYIKEIILIAKDNDERIDDYIKLSNKIIVHKVGGTTRAESVLNGLQKLTCRDNDWILVHDAVRCCLSQDILNKLIVELHNDKVGGILAAEATDTIKYVNNDKQITIKHTIPRKDVYLAQTPQMFRYHILLQALKNSDLDKITDEASAIENLGLDIKIIPSDNSNIKVTNPMDRNLAEFFLSLR